MMGGQIVGWVDVQDRLHIMHGVVKMYVMRWSFCWTTFLYNWYRQVVRIPVDNNCDPLVTDLFLFCYERDFMISLSDAKQADIIEAFNIWMIFKA